MSDVPTRDESPNRLGDSDRDDASSGSALGGFGHASSIEPGAVEDQDDDDGLPDPEGLADAHADPPTLPAQRGNG